MPSGAIATFPTAPIGLPFGSLAQPSTTRYGFGRTCARAVPSQLGDVTIVHASTIPRADATTSPNCRALLMTAPLLPGVSCHLLWADLPVVLYGLGASFVGFCASCVYTLPAPTATSPDEEANERPSSSIHERHWGLPFNAADTDGATLQVEHYYVSYRVR
jgi:hypothetical protein